MSGKPDHFIQRSYGGVALFIDGIAVHASDRMQTDLDATVPPGSGPIEYLICERVDDVDHNVVVDSDYDFDEALRLLFTCAPGHYMVAIRP